ncbi:MAG TPA: hypothetical protein VK760_02590 [Candidatus Acidoferrales bacterium]|jgi:hypothetical protein|nr:hypothetical protein [Candidatus Acidoferrales bacterium]
MKIATAGLLLAALIVTSACSNKASTTATTSGDVTNTAAAAPADAAATATPDNSAASPAPASSGMTVTTKDGTATIGGGVDPSKLGAPVYPGATIDPDAQGSISAQTPEGSTYIQMFKTPDGFDKVYDFYKAQMPAGSEGMKMSMGGASSATWQVGKDGGPDQVLVQVNADKTGKVSILITHVIKTNASPAPAST